MCGSGNRAVTERIPQNCRTSHSHDVSWKPDVRQIAQTLFPLETADVSADSPTSEEKIMKVIINEKNAIGQLINYVDDSFVNVVESKEALMRSGIPYIVAEGRKGGSNVAAAICNALLRIAEARDEGLH